MTGALLRLAGPMQSWGEHSTFAERDTLSFPTLSGIVGLLACAAGHDRNQPPGELSLLRAVIRIDRPGTQIIDFHTVGGGLTKNATIPTAESDRHRPKYRSQANALVSKRHYLADAAFLVALDGPDHVIEEISAHLRAPRWPIYLGRRSCPPTEPVLLAAGVPDAEALLSTCPLPRRRPIGGVDTVPVDFVRDAPTASAVQDTAIEHEVWDVAQSFARFSRRHTRRRVAIESRQLPADLCKGLGGDYISALASHLRAVPGAIVKAKSPS